MDWVTSSRSGYIPGSRDEGTQYHTAIRNPLVHVKNVRSKLSTAKRLSLFFLKGQQAQTIKRMLRGTSTVGCITF